MDFIKKLVFVLTTVLMLSSCAQTTSYQRLSEQYGVGYSETVISPQSYQVSYNGQESSSLEQINDFVLLRSAELTLENGYRYLNIVHLEPVTLSRDVNITRVRSNVISHTRYTQNGVDLCRVENNGMTRTMEMTNTMSKKHNNESNKIYRETVMEYYPDSYEIKTQKVIATIKFQHKKAQNGYDAYNAREIIKSISEKYQLEL